MIAVYMAAKEAVKNQKQNHADIWPCIERASTKFGVSQESVAKCVLTIDPIYLYPIEKATKK